jgi:hypothetical protein
MGVIVLLNSRFDITADDGFVVFALPNVLENALMANFAGGDDHTAEVEHNFAEQFLLNNAEDVRFGSGVDYDFFEQVQCEHGDVFLR